MEKLVLTVTELPSREHTLASLDLREFDPDEVLQLLDAAMALAVPKALLRRAVISGRGDSYIELDGVCISCPLMAKNFAGLSGVYPYICTCGRELYDWAASLSDPIHQYIADSIKLYYLRLAHKALFRHAEELMPEARHISRMNPGSLPAWPLSGQRELFKIIGGGEDIGVELTDSFLMLPDKSTSGILFASEKEYENCSLCPKENCPGRRAAFSGELL